MAQWSEFSKRVLWLAHRDFIEPMTIKYMKTYIWSREDMLALRDFKLQHGWDPQKEMLVEAYQFYQGLDND